jgi:type II restriction/modification system DNA methylase subunit YeeA
MTITQIENNIVDLLNNFSQENFIFDFLLAYGEPKATITRLEKGELNQLESKGELLHRKKVFFKVTTEQLLTTIDTLKNEVLTQKQKPRFVIVTDYQTLLAYDTKTSDTLDINIKDLVKHYDFFLPLAGMEKATHIDENPADVKASNKLAKLYDEILKTNPTKTHEEVHALNVFLTRLLFCYFAEDSNIFEDNVFTNSISNHTQVDGSDVVSYLDRLFDVFNTSNDRRDESLPQYLKSFPYVNGGLFRDKHPLPKFTTKSRAILIEIGGLDWSEINPDIFGSMIQAVVTPEHRGDMGMHYTSVPNIMKVMKPLFLDELVEEFENNITNKKKLQQLLIRISNLKIFDPACGSGNFLIIAYKELRRLEMQIISAIDDLSPQKSFTFSEIKLTQFYGIELDDFAHEVAILSLWLAEHQMNLEFYKEFGRTSPALPLQDGGNIVHGNATRIDWKEVCPKNDGDEIYILGNPPYLGSSLQNKEQKNDMEIVLSNNLKNFKNLDYISCWFFKAAMYIKNFNSRFAFVSTNSITQGEQVGLLWPYILKDLEIFFACQSFQWSNNAKSKATVFVVIVGIDNISKKRKRLINQQIINNVDKINPYLLSGSSPFIYRNNTPISQFPPMMKGNYPTDDGNLILSLEEKNFLLNNYPESKIFIKKFIGSQEFIKGIERWCLWIDTKDLKIANSIKEIKERIEKVSEFRSKSKAPSTREKAHLGHRFIQIQSEPQKALLIPSVSSERRKYIPVGFVNEDTVVNAQSLVIYNPKLYIFGIISSHMHMVWMKTISGKLENRYRYSSTLVYNNFPFPDISEKHVKCKGKIHQ